MCYAVRGLAQTYLQVHINKTQNECHSCSGGHWKLIGEGALVMDTALSGIGKSLTTEFIIMERIGVRDQ